jgi:hypothetical protein
MKNILRLIPLLILSTVVSCDNVPTDPYKYPINPYLKEIKFSNPSKSGMFYMAVWRENTIFAIQPMSKFVMDNGYNLVQDIRLEEGSTGSWSYIDANKAGTKLLLVKKAYFDNSSSTSLYEYNVITGQFETLYDFSSNIATARYYPNDDNKVVYYTAGNPNQYPGYYLYDIISRQDSLLFPYLSQAGIWETLHGFDIHPNGDTLLVPMAVGQFNDIRPPKLGIVSIKIQTLDTLDISFNLSFLRVGLWVRYNHDGSRILYCCFPENAYGYVTNDNSEVGIIESTTLEKTTLDVNTNNESEHGSVQLVPNWSPDETAIVFGSGNVNKEGLSGTRKLYILKKLI